MNETEASITYFSMVSICIAVVWCDAQDTSRRKEEIHAVKILTRAVDWRSVRSETAHSFKGVSNDSAAQDSMLHGYARTCAIGVVYLSFIGDAFSQILRGAGARFDSDRALEHGARTVCGPEDPAGLGYAPAE
jgi:hypothetical protein